MAFNRRKFLKSTIAAGAFLATGASLNFKAWANEKAKEPVELKYSYCNTCSSHCGLWVHVKNGRAWKVTGNKDHSRSLGKLCARAHAGLAWIYDETRIKQPLKRVGQTFQPISWEQATTEIGDKLKKIIEEHGPRGIVWGHNARQTTTFYAPLFMHALGSRTVMTHNASCNTSVTKAGGTDTYGRAISADRNRTDYIMTIGRNYGEGIRTVEATQYMAAIARGAKTVCVDPRMSATGALADEWVPIRPGTDLAFALAICNVLIKENLYDKEFVEKETEGFDKFLEVVGEYTPEWAQTFCDVPAGTIRRLARELAAHKPKALVDPSWKGAFGANYKNSSETARAVAYINALLGNIGKPGGISHGSALEIPFGSLDKEKFPTASAPTLPRIDGQGIKGEFPLAPGQGLPHYVAEKAKKGEIKAWFVYNHNPVRVFPDYDHMRAGFLATDLVVVIETHMTETAQCADYILPECSWAEREEVVEQISNSISMRTKVVPKMYAETSTLPEMLPMIAKKAGVGHLLNFTLNDVNEARIKPHGITLDELRKKGVHRAQMKSNSIPKFKFYNQNYVDAGFSGVARWVAPAVGTSVNNYQFFILNGKQGYHSHTATIGIPQLAQISYDYNAQRVWINAGKAAKLGIKDNDWVIISNGSVQDKAQVKVTERIHPDAMFMPGGYGRRFEATGLAEKVGGVNPNDFVKYQLEPHVGHAMMQECVVTIVGKA